MGTNLLDARRSWPRRLIRWGVRISGWKPEVTPQKMAALLLFVYLWPGMALATVFVVASVAVLYGE